MVASFDYRGMGESRPAGASLREVDVDLFDWAADTDTVIEALGLGFFSIGVGLGLMMTYAAYSGRTVRLVEVAAVSVVADTLISLLAGLMAGAVLLTIAIARSVPVASATSGLVSA